MKQEDLKKLEIQSLNLIGRLLFEMVWLKLREDEDRRKEPVSECIWEEFNEIGSRLARVSLNLDHPFSRNTFRTSKK